MNVNDYSAVRACTSCQMCGAICTKNAITIHLSKDGFYIPVIDADKCIDCGMCVKVCNRFDNEIILTDQNLLDKTKLYAASAKDDNLVCQTTSGGIGDILAKEFIHEGYKVVGVIYDSEKDCALHQVAETVDETDAFRGSKYIQSYTVDAFQQVVRNAKSEKYAVFGLPCQIYAISRYLEMLHVRDRHVLIDLYCHGCPTIFVWKKLSLHIRNKTNVKKFSDVIWRSKLRGWGTFVLEVKSKGKRIYNSTPIHNEFFNLFFCNQVLNESCKDCKLRGTLAYTDIRMGDYWGHLFSKTTRGVSGISICSEKGNYILNQIKPQINCEQKDYNTFLPYQSWGNVYEVNQDLRTQLFAALENPHMSISKVYNILRKRQTNLERIKVIIKQVIFYLPFFAVKLIRKFLK